MKKGLFLLPIGAILFACNSSPTDAPTNASAVVASDSVAAPPEGASSGALRGWLSWRGPHQNGTSDETGLIDTLAVDGENHLWSYELPGRGCPVIANGRVYAVGYEGAGPDLEEVLVCLDEETGERIWEHRFSDFLSDTIYTRYAIGAPTIDPETGNVFALTGAGLIHAFTSDGELLWQDSMMETLGRLTFPNGRVGAPLILDDLVIIHFIFASWGPLGPASDRFFAFDKHSGKVVWASTPGLRPVDSSFSYPVVEERDGRTLLYAGLGGGHVACLDGRTGAPIWRFPFAHGGVNSSALLYGDQLIVIHGKENVDSSALGRMVSLKLGVPADGEGFLPKEAETWRNDLVAFTSSPVLYGDRVYQTTLTGELNCVDAKTGEVLWHEKLGPDQLHASPAAADGKLYVPMTNGSFYVIRPTDERGEILCQVQLEGSCLGAPAIANGRIYVHTTTRLYCFGDGKSVAPEWPAPARKAAGDPVALQIVPYDVSFRAGESTDPIEVRRIDASGRVVDTIPATDVEFTKPPFVALDDQGRWTASKTGVAMIKAKTADGLEGSARLRMTPSLPYSQDFGAIELDQADGEWAWPPGEWLGGRMKWQIVSVEGDKMAMRRMDNPLFQRTISLFGDPDDSNYTLEADMMADGGRRTIASPGLVNQRYLFTLKGNYQEFEVSSNMEHLKVSVPFSIKAKTWYRMKTRVDLEADGTAVVRGKAWPRDEAEPDAWTIEVRDPNGHTHGAAGLYGFTPQSRYTLYIDNLTVTPNE